MPGAGKVEMQRASTVGAAWALGAVREEKEGKPDVEQPANEADLALAAGVDPTPTSVKFTSADLGSAASVQWRGGHADDGCYYPEFLTQTARQVNLRAGQFLEQAFYHIFCPFSLPFMAYFHQYRALERQDMLASRLAPPVIVPQPWCTWLLIFLCLTAWPDIAKGGIYHSEVLFTVLITLFHKLMQSFKYGLLTKHEYDAFMASPVPVGHRWLFTFLLLGDPRELSYRYVQHELVLAAERVEVNTASYFVVPDIKRSAAAWQDLLRWPDVVPGGPLACSSDTWRCSVEHMFIQATRLSENPNSAIAEGKDRSFFLTPWLMGNAVSLIPGFVRLATGDPFFGRGPLSILVGGLCLYLTFVGSLIVTALLQSQTLLNNRLISSSRVLNNMIRSGHKYGGLTIKLDTTIPANVRAWGETWLLVLTFGRRVRQRADCYVALLACCLFIAFVWVVFEINSTDNNQDLFSTPLIYYISLCLLIWGSIVTRSLISMVIANDKLVDSQLFWHRRRLTIRCPERLPAEKRASFLDLGGTVVGNKVATGVEDAGANVAKRRRRSSLISLVGTGGALPPPLTQRQSFAEAIAEGVAEEVADLEEIMMAEKQRDELDDLMETVTNLISSHMTQKPLRFLGFNATWPLFYSLLSFWITIVLYLGNAIYGF